MEKAINKPWRMLYWEQRVALPIREQLRNNYRYVDIGFDIDKRFGSAAGIENLRKWVRSQRSQEMERVEGERQRVPGSPQGRPLSEVQKLRARVFAQMADKEAEGGGGGDGDGGEGGVGGGSATTASSVSNSTAATAAAASAAASAAAAAAAAATNLHGRDTSLEPLATLFSP
ncbi:unnamed protein product, partial [Laminaria digitata]